MKPLSLLLLIFLSACSIVQIEIRDRKPSTTHKTYTKREQPQKQELKTKNTPVLISSPVKGRAVRTERGYFIVTSCGEFFRSVSDGRVLYAGDDIKNYGWVVMVDGGDGFVYVYGYAESLLVRRGENVRKGQPLGKVGKGSDDCGILFEVRDVEGKPLSFELML